MLTIIEHGVPRLIMMMVMRHAMIDTKLSRSILEMVARFHPHLSVAAVPAIAVRRI